MVALGCSDASVVEVVCLGIVILRDGGSLARDHARPTRAPILIPRVILPYEAALVRKVHLPTTKLTFMFQVPL